MLDFRIFKKCKLSKKHEEHLKVLDKETQERLKGIRQQIAINEKEKLKPIKLNDFYLPIKSMCQ